MEDRLLNSIDEDGDGLAESSTFHGRGKRPEQIGYYEGEARQILDRAKTNVRLYLATVDLFPDIDDIRELTQTVYNDACIDVLGQRHPSNLVIAYFIFSTDEHCLSSRRRLSSLYKRHDEACK